MEEGSSLCYVMQVKHFVKNIFGFCNMYEAINDDIKVSQMVQSIVK